MEIRAATPPGLTVRKSKASEAEAGAGHVPPLQEWKLTLGPEVQTPPAPGGRAGWGQQLPRVWIKGRWIPVLPLPLLSSLCDQVT